jgi:electron transport complex protein RnfG
MAKLDSSLKNMTLSLLLISLFMSAALGFVYNVTKEPITKSMKAKETNAIKDVLPSFDNDPMSSPLQINGLTFYIATKGKDTVGYAAKTYTDRGYSGRFDLMVGFLPNGSINNIVVLQQNETPGLGSNMSQDKFRSQFLKLNIGELPDKLLKVRKDGGEIDAISAATITSRAYCNALQKAYDELMKIQEESK